jgi:hypothetical protein
MIRVVAWADAVAVGWKADEFGAGVAAADCGNAAAANKRRGPTISRVVSGFAQYG